VVGSYPTAGQLNPIAGFYKLLPCRFHFQQNSDHTISPSSWDIEKFSLVEKWNEFFF
jgi:hypothetical protein